MEQVFKDHNSQQGIVRTARERTRQEALSSTANLSDVLVEAVNLPVAIAFRNQQQIESVEKSLLAEV
ncbi:hypothetical protein BDR26DRAFT_883401, partial [Obelidium mucronatum]